ncbi:hypothetical protein YC2023_078040 [Brassica napus]
MDHTQVKYDIVLRKNETYGDLVAMMRGKYRVLPSAPVALTYDFPEWMKVPGDYATPPVDILEDKDVELFMAVRMDYVNLTLCAAYRNMEVGRYHTMRREEFGLTEDGTDVVPPKPILWRAPDEPPAGANLTLAIATTDDVDGGRVGSYGKGKGVMTGPDIRGGQLFGLQMGSGSGFANTEGGDVALEEGEAYAGKQKGKLPP